MRSRNLASSPVAVAVAMRTMASVGASSPTFVFSPGLRPGVNLPGLMFRVSPPVSCILLFREPPIYPHLAHRLAPRVLRGPRRQRLRLRPQPELAQHRSHRERRGHAVAVFDLEGDADALAHELSAVHALRPHLRDHAPGMRAHHLGTGPPFAGDQLGMLQHRVTDRTLEPRIRECHADERHRKARDAAAVPGHPNPLRGHTRPATHLGEAALLHGVLEPRVELRRPAAMLRQRQHPRVLARTVRVHSREPHAARLVVFRHGFGEGPVRSAQQVALRATDLLEQLARARHLPRLARVRRADERQVLRRELESLGGAVLDQRQRLERLRRGAPERDRLGIAGCGDERTVGVHDRDVHAVARLDDGASPQLDDHALPAPCSVLFAVRVTPIPATTTAPPISASAGGVSCKPSHAMTPAPTGSPSAATLTVVARYNFSAQFMPVWPSSIGPAASAPNTAPSRPANPVAGPPRATPPTPT